MKGYKFTQLTLDFSLPKTEIFILTTAYKTLGFQLFLAYIETKVVLTFATVPIILTLLHEKTFLSRHDVVLSCVSKFHPIYKNLYAKSVMTFFLFRSTTFFILQRKYNFTYTEEWKARKTCTKWNYFQPFASFSVYTREMWEYEIHTSETCNHIHTNMNFCHNWDFQLVGIFFWEYKWKFIDFSNELLLLLLFGTWVGEKQ